MLSIKETQAGRSYEITEGSDPDKKVVLDFINASTPGILTNEVLLLVLIMRLGSLNVELPCSENHQVIDLLVQATEVLALRSRRLGQKEMTPIAIAEVRTMPAIDNYAGCKPMNEEAGLEVMVAVSAGETRPTIPTQPIVSQPIIPGPSSVVDWVTRPVEKVTPLEVSKTGSSQGPLADGLLNQLQRARALLTELHALGSDEVKQLIEKRTGPWMVWGVNQQEPVR